MDGSIARTLMTRSVQAFLLKEGITTDDIKVTKTVDASTRIYIDDHELCRRWVDYHLANAVLQVTLPSANMSAGARARC